MKKLLNKIRSICSEQKFTQRALGFKVEVSCRNLSDIECGRHSIRFVNLCRLAHGVRMSASDFLCFDDVYN